MSLYRKRPIVIEATQWFKPGDHPAVVVDYFDGGQGPLPQIKTPEGDLFVERGNWIITGIEGEHYAIRDSVFHKTYEAVD